MGYFKEVKSNAYFKRFQVKFRRRRAGKTDYRARKRLITQDKNKYNSPKYRFAVRFTNKDICCQIIYATIAGDRVVAHAYAHELEKYGLKVGLTNYAAAYCVGLLLARRTLKKYELDEDYEGQTEVDGEDFHVEAQDDGARPFRAFLDVGIKSTSTGSKVFAAMKGACDGGLDIPHNSKRFAGYDPANKELDTEVFQRYILGGHVSDYMETMRDEEPEKFAEHFSKYIEEGVNPEDLEDLYPSVHEAIREDPEHVGKERSKPADAKKWKALKHSRTLSMEERKAALKKKLLDLQAAADDDEDGDDDEEEDDE
jgi:large subunit ribosomal protein L5e